MVRVAKLSLISLIKPFEKGYYKELGDTKQVSPNSFLLAIQAESVCCVPGFLLLTHKLLSLLDVNAFARQLVAVNPLAAKVVNR